MTDLTLDGCYRRIVASMLLLAISDAQAGDDEAREWLRSDDAAEWLSMLDIEREHIDAWRNSCAGGGAVLNINN